MSGGGMDHDGEGLLRIGLFSRLTAISVRMLRHYQEQRVLEPTVTDPFTAIGAHIAATGAHTGPMFNIYRVTPMENPDPAAWVTDVCFPVVEE